MDAREVLMNCHNLPGYHIHIHCLIKKPKLECSDFPAFLSPSVNSVTHKHLFNLPVVPGTYKNIVSQIRNQLSEKLHLT